jgi:hypothetical protein
MNKRIKELTEQATTYHKGGLGTEIESFDKEKFAELIVKECAWLVDENDISLPYGTFGKLIKGHFGVEHDVVKTFRGEE